jgi:hypothetical protein
MQDSLDTVLKTYSQLILRAPGPSRVHLRLFHSSFGVPRPLTSVKLLVVACDVGYYMFSVFTFYFGFVRGLVDIFRRGG